MRKQHFKKIIAPIIIAVVFGIFFLSITVSLVNLAVETEKWWFLLVAIIPVILLIMLIIVTLQRINEIRGGQEDDLSKY